MKIEDITKIDKINGKVILATITESKGSVPRNTNVSMVISLSKNFGTIGGGELEYQVIKKAKNLISINKNFQTIDLPLGPSLGQCCGGFVKIKLVKYNNGKSLINDKDLKNNILKNNLNLYIFGAGHVGKSLVSKLDGVGFNIYVIDSRQSFINKIKHNYAIPILSKDNSVIINHAQPSSYYVIMTHSHQIDLNICSLLLNKNDFSYIGLIGSKTKKMRFFKKLFNLGYSKELINQIECPIGFTSIEGKEPDIIAISIIARLLEHRSSSVSFKNHKYIKLIKI